MHSGTSERVVLVAFVAAAVFAGGNGVAIRFSNRDLDPLWGAGLRFVLATIVLAAVMVAMRLRLQTGRALFGAVVYGALAFGGGFALAYYALVEMHAGFGQVLLALVPLTTLLLAVAWRQERLRWASALGAVVAVGGVAVTTQAQLGEPVPMLCVLAALGSVLCLAQATVVVRRFPGRRRLPRRRRLRRGFRAVPLRARPLERLAHVLRVRVADPLPRSARSR